MGVLNRSVHGKTNLINAMTIVNERGWTVAEHHEKRTAHTDSIRLEVETDAGRTIVEGAVVLDKPRLMQVDGIHCEASLAGHLIYLKNEDVPGVIGHVGTVLGRNHINIASFSLGRQEAPPPVIAIALVETDEPVSEAVLAELRTNTAVKLARNVELG